MLKMLTFNIEGMDLNELYLTQAQLSQIDQGYQRDGVTTPEDVVSKLIEVSDEINKKNKAELMRQLRDAEARQQMLLTRDERRTQNEELIKKLREKLKIV